MLSRSKKITWDKWYFASSVVLHPTKLSPLDGNAAMGLRTACQKHDLTRPKPKKPPRSWIFFWTSGTPRGPFESDIKNFHHGTRKALFQKTDFGAHFRDDFGRCSRVPRHSPTKFEHKIALLSSYYLLQFQPKRSTRGRDRSRGVSPTERVFWPFLARFCP